jgi:hypothetical protein
VRVLAAAFLAIVVALSAGCGSDESSSGRSDSDNSSGGTIEALWRAPGEDVGLVQGTSDYAPGRLRVSFLVIRGDGKAVSQPHARVWLSRGLQAAPFQERTASLEPIGVPGVESDAGVDGIYVTDLDVAKPGKYWLLAEPVGGKPIQALGNLVVGRKAESPAVGDKAYPSENPTIASTGGDFAKLTTATPPDKELLRYSIADSLAAGKPFVVAFATPKFCASRTCGPTVDVVDHVRQQLGSSDVRFIHVEIYEDNDPQKGVNQWVKEWNLPTEPWVFVVGRDGRIKAKFEGSVSVEELEAAARRVA